MAEDRQKLCYTLTLFLLVPGYEWKVSKFTAGHGTHTIFKSFGNTRSWLVQGMISEHPDSPWIWNSKGKTNYYLLDAKLLINNIYYWIINKYSQFISACKITIYKWIRPIQLISDCKSMGSMPNRLPVLRPGSGSIRVEVGTWRKQVYRKWEQYLYNRRRFHFIFK